MNTPRSPIPHSTHHSVHHTTEVRALQVSQHELSFIDAFGSLVQDELDRRKSRLLERRFTLSGLPERNDLKDFDFGYNPRLPKRDLLQLAALNFIDAKENALFIGPPGLGKSHLAKAIAQLAITKNTPRSSPPTDLSTTGARYSAMSSSSRRYSTDSCITAIYSSSRARAGA